MNILRKCKCGITATTDTELELFTKDKRAPYGRSTSCKVCTTKAANERSTSSERNAYQKQHRIKNAEAISKQRRDYRERNSQKLLEERLVNVEHRALLDREYKINNPDKVRANCARYRARKRNQTPTLTVSEKAELSAIYELANSIIDGTGVCFTVDHIIPLARGGIHHPLNLQIISRRANRLKSDTLPLWFTYSVLSIHCQFYGCSLSDLFVNHLRSR